MPIHLKTLRLPVKNLDKSLDFYQRLFSLVPIEKDNKFCLFDLSGTFLELVVEDEKNPLGIGGAIGYFSVDSFTEYTDLAKELGAEIWREPLKINQTGLTIVQFKDPFGNVFGFEGMAK